jgi:rRNA-processing protein FCF1
MLMPMAARLSKALDTVVEDLVVLCLAIEVNYINYSGEGIVIIAPDYYWGERTPSQQHKHLNITRRYKQIGELISVLIRGAPPSLTRQFKDAEENFMTWLELGSNWSLSTDKKSNEKKIREAAGALYAVVSVLSAGPREQVILVPDTNSLLGSAAPSDYRSISTQKAFEFLLLPTVLSELDELKMLHRNQDVREKAKKVITRIKGWRAQGPLLDGVLVDKTIIVRALHNEPKVADSLSWLDADNADDRIVASVLHIQATSPSAHVILVTGDINLQNKADAAMIETVEINFESLD